MRKKASRALAVLAILGWALLSAPAGALSGMSVAACVSDTQFEFDVTVNDVESELLLIELLNVSAGHIQWISTTIDVNQATGDVSFSIAPHIVESNVAARDTFSLPFSDVVLSSVAGGWLFLLAGFYGGTVFTVYSLSSAQAHDLSEPDDLVKTAGAMLIAFGIGAIVGPMIGGVMMRSIAPGALFGFNGAVALLISLYAFRRSALRQVRALGRFLPTPSSQYTSGLLYRRVRDEVDRELRRYGQYSGRRF